LQVVRLNASFGCWPLGEQLLEYAPRDPDHGAVLADLDPELHGLPLGIPAGVLGEGEEHDSIPWLGLLNDVLYTFGYKIATGERPHRR
jgi:hypothetical protein